MVAPLIGRALVSSTTKQAAAKSVPVRTPAPARRAPTPAARPAAPRTVERGAGERGSFSLSRETGAGTKKSKVRVNNFQAGLILTLALTCDGLQFLLSFLHVLPWIGNALAFIGVLMLTACAYLTIGLWFKFLDVNYFSGKRAMLRVVTLLATIGIELIPLINAIPAITAGALTVFISSRIEDALGTDTKGAELKIRDMALKRQMALDKARGSERARLMLQYAAENRRLMASAATGQTFDEEYVDEPLPVDAATEDEVTRRVRRLQEATGGLSLEHIDPSFYGLKTEKDQQAYRVWNRAKHLGALADARGQTFDIRKTTPTPNAYKE